MNPLHFIDFYKAGHRQQYPEGTERIVSNFTPRYSKHANVEDKTGIIFYGLQYFIQHFLLDCFGYDFFMEDKDAVIADYKRRMDNALGKDAIPVDHVAALHDLGYLPIKIKAVEEGTMVPIGIPCLTIENTRPEFFWLTNYLETILSTYLWLPCTSATTAYNYRKLFDEFAEKTGAPKEFVDFQGHDFSFRGMSSPQSAVASGSAHLLSFRGTDTVAAIDFLEEFYEANSDNELVGCSVPATEHSVMCMGGAEDELGTFRRLITKIYPKGIVSIVSDTWDFWRVLTKYALELKPEIMAREGKVVFRPDSGDPADIICGNLKLLQGNQDPEYKGAVEVLWEIFGGTINAKGYKELDSHIGLIYGDSISFETAKDILQRLEAKGFASSNIVFGIGSFTYQYATRDTWGWAVKATYGEVNGEARNIFKKPKTDNGGKNSAKGLLSVEKDSSDQLILRQEVTETEFNSEQNMLKIVWANGAWKRRTSLSNIRKKVSENGNIQG